MKKSIIYGMILATALLSSCKGDYTDWANPQTNAQEEAKNVTFTIAPTASLDLNTYTEETVKMFTPTIEGTDVLTPVGYEVELNKITDDGAPAEFESFETLEDGSAMTADVKEAIENFYGKYPTERTVKMIVKVILKNEVGEAFYKLSNEVEYKVKPEDFGTVYKLTVNDEVVADLSTDEATYPNFSVSYKGTADDEWAIIDANGDPVADGTFAESAKYNFSFNAESGFASSEKAPVELYMTGDHYGWGDIWKPLTPVWGDDCDEFWTVVYLEEGEQFKFAPQKDWGGDFGMSATVDDQAGAQLTGTDNCIVGKSGWYLLHVTNGAKRIIQVLEPNVYLIGDAAGEWNIADSHKFTVPETKDGDFVSPAFVKDAELRMCVIIPGHEDNWWHSEFIITNGKIDYRGKGGDQARLKVTEGQKAYLNFTNNTGEIK